MLDIIKIGWKEYDIEIAEPVESDLYVNTDECYGRIDYDKQKIFLREQNSELQNRETLIHEVLHGIENMYLINLGEDTATKLASAIATVLHDNNLEIRKKGQS